jgi:ribulose-5-phosphate 4-epimerase/fuculose-1-phosphate aldolase
MTLDVKREVALANRVLFATGLSAGITVSLGHASMRIPHQPERFVVKGRGYRMDALSAMRSEDMVTCDLDGNFIDGPPGSTQCFEVKMHSWLYKLYPEVQSVVHVHPRFTVLLSSLGQNVKPMCQEGIGVVARPLPMYPHTKVVVTDEEAEQVARLMNGYKAALLKGHGATTIGASLEESVMNMLHLEEQARMNYYALSAFGPDYPSLPEELVQEVLHAPSYADLPHFKDVFARSQGQPRVNGVWQYYTAQVADEP